MANRKGKFKIKNGSGSYDQVMLETQLGQVVDSPIKSLERSTRYEQNDVVAEQTCKGTFFVCITAGTTAASAPSGYSSVSEGGSVTDGTAVFTAHRFNNLANTAAITAHNKSETAHQNIDFVESISSADDGLHYKMRNGSADKVIDIVSVGDIAFRYKLAPGRVKLNGATVNRSDYPRLVQFATDNGLWTSTPGSNPQLFGQGDGSTTFVLPDYRNRVIQGGDTVGKKSAGLPNINGYVDAAVGASHTSVSGPFTQSLYPTTQDGGDNGDGEIIRGTRITFNASKSNSIYGASTTVQPPAIVLIPQIKY